jgi:hypothetical protein
MPAPWQNEAQLLLRLVFRSRNDLVLYGFCQISEISRVSGNSNKEIGILIGLSLRLSQRIRIQDIDLRLHSAMTEIFVKKDSKKSCATLPVQDVRCELDVTVKATQTSVWPHLSDQPYGLDTWKPPPWIASVIS